MALAEERSISSEASCPKRLGLSTTNWQPVCAMDLENSAVFLRSEMSLRYFRGIFTPLSLTQYRKARNSSMC